MKKDQSPTCKNHPNRKALSNCHSCGNWFCHECLEEGLQYYFCKKTKCLRAFKLELLTPCPSCSKKIKPTARFCPACGRRLKPVRSEEKDDLVTVARFQNPIEAHLARTALENKGLWAFVADEHVLSIDPFYDLSLGGTRLRVRKSEEEMALRLLGRQAKGSMFVPPRWYAILMLVPVFVSWVLWTILYFFQN